MSIESLKPLERYKKLHSVFWRIVVISVVLILIAFSLAYYSKWPFNKLGIAKPFEAEEIRRILFISYMCIFGSVWITYFISRWDVRFFRVRSLRRLLVETSNHWENGSRNLIYSLHRKSQSSMTTVAMMIAASLLVLGEVHSIIEKVCWGNTDLWNKVMIIGAATAGMISLICFIISVDALDTLFNKFKTDNDYLKKYFYQKTINPRYFGLILLILGVIFIIAYYNLIFSCVVLGLFLSIGYSHWFPNVDKIRHSLLESIIIGIILVLAAVLVEWYF